MEQETSEKVNPLNKLFCFLVIEKDFQSAEHVSIPKEAKHDQTNDLFLNVKKHVEESHIHDAIMEYFQKNDFVVVHEGEGIFQVTKDDKLQKIILVTFVVPNEHIANPFAMISVSHFNM